MYIKIPIGQVIFPKQNVINNIKLSPPPTFYAKNLVGLVISLIQLPLFEKNPQGKVLVRNHRYAMLFKMFYIF